LLSLAATFTVLAYMRPTNQSTLTSALQSILNFAPIINTLVSVSILMPQGTVERPLVKFGPNLPPKNRRSQASVLMVEAPGTAPGSCTNIRLHQTTDNLFIY